MKETQKVRATMLIGGEPRQDFEGEIVLPIYQSAVHKEFEVLVTRCHIPMSCVACKIGKCVGHKRAVATDCHKVIVL